MDSSYYFCININTHYSSLSKLYTSQTITICLDDYNNFHIQNIHEHVYMYAHTDGEKKRYIELLQYFHNTWVNFDVLIKSTNTEVYAISNDFKFYHICNEPSRISTSYLHPVSSMSPKWGFHVQECEGDTNVFPNL